MSIEFSNFYIPTFNFNNSTIRFIFVALSTLVLYVVFTLLVFLATGVSLEKAVIVGFFTANVRVTVPILYSALGEIIAQTSGVVNLSGEGMMIIGAFAGFVGANKLGNPWLGILVGMLGGGAVALLAGTFTVSLGANQAIVGVMLVFVMEGLATYLNTVVFGGSYISPTGNPIQSLNIPGLSDIPWVGEILFQQNILVYLAVFLVPLLTFILTRTTLGLRLRGVGENPLAAESMGTNVIRTRFMALFIGGMLSGLGGSFLTLAYLSTYSDGIVAGRGWIAIALVYFGQWNPGRVLAGALFFGGVIQMQIRLQQSGLGVPVEFLQMLPYVLTIVVMLFVYREYTGPASTWIPYRREKRT